MNHINKKKHMLTVNIGIYYITLYTKVTIYYDKGKTNIHTILTSNGSKQNNIFLIFAPPRLPLTQFYLVILVVEAYNILIAIWMHGTQLTFPQFFLIWPLEPVRGPRLLIFSIASAKSLEKMEGLKVYVLTMESVEPPLKSAWSERKSPLFFSKSLK